MKRKKLTLPIARYHLAPQSGTAFTVKQDHRIRVLDTEGEQVADLVCFARLNPDEYLSSGRTIDYSEKIYLNTEISGKGSITVKTPLSRAGDFIELQARMDLIIGVTACSAGKCNNFRCTAVDVEVYASREQS